jgi:Fe-S-cluster containining protein
MTDCSMCGDCCENIRLNIDRGTLLQRVSDGKAAGTYLKDAVFILNNMIPDGTVARQGNTVKQTLQCKKFDKETRKCTAHNDRPEMCRRYPWYGKEPVKGDTTMGGRCSFLVDAGYKMLPIVEVK